MTTAKAKAIDLVGKYVFYTLTDFSNENFEQTKQCALIAVDEIINEIHNNFLQRYNATDRYFYWQEVKKEIEKL